MYLLGSTADEYRREGCPLELLPSSILQTILTELDVASIFSLASTCTSLHLLIYQTIPFLPKFNLLDFALSLDLLGPLLSRFSRTRSVRVNCCNLDDSAIDLLLNSSLREISLRNCVYFSGRLLAEIGRQCKQLRALYLGSLAENRRRPIHIFDLEELTTSCSQLEKLVLMFDVSFLPRRPFGRLWDSASMNLTSLEIGFVYEVTIVELLSPNLTPKTMIPSPFVLCNIKELSLSVDYITDAIVSTISISLKSLSHLDLRDAPIAEPNAMFDLTNAGLLHVNSGKKLKHLCLIRSQEFSGSCFSRVNDLGLLLMADRCVNMESITLGGFCRVTDTGFRAILHSCPNLQQISIFHGVKLTDLVFHDISATTLSLKHVSLRWCHMLTSFAMSCLTANSDLRVLDLRECRSMGDEALAAISDLCKLRILLLDGSDISDTGIEKLYKGSGRSLASLSIRGCKRLTDKGISRIFNSGSKSELKELDVSNIPYLSDKSILVMVKSRVPLTNLRIRQCPLVGDASIMALASMNGEEEHTNRIEALDFYNCGRITPLVFRWIVKPYFPRLRRVGVPGNGNWDAIDALGKSRPSLIVASSGEELGSFLK